MKIGKVVAPPFVSLMLSITMIGAAAANEATAFTTVLTYRAGSQSSPASPVFHSHGYAYRFQLCPDANSRSHFDLVLEGADDSCDGVNLFYPPGTNWHGWQRWMFNAAEFEPGGPPWSPRYATRTVDLPERGLSVQIKVLRAEVKDDQFSDLAVRLIARVMRVRSR